VKQSFTQIATTVDFSFEAMEVDRDHIHCSSCMAHFVPAMAPLCQRCGSPLSRMGMCQQCQYHPLGLSGLRAVSSYQEPLRSCIHALKYDGNTVS